MNDLMIIDAPVITENNGFAVTLTGIEVAGNPTYEDWCKELDSVWHSTNAVQWATGDLMLYGEDKFGEKFSQVVDNTRWKIHTLQNIITTCKAFPVNERRPNLVFSSHAECASLEGENRKLALDKLESGEWDRARVRAFKKELRGETSKPRKQAITITPEAVMVDGRLRYLFPENMPAWIFGQPMTVYVETRAA